MSLNHSRVVNYCEEKKNYDEMKCLSDFKHKPTHLLSSENAQL